MKAPEKRILMAWHPQKEEPEDIEMDPLFVGLIFRLPKMDSEWPIEERDKWMMMFNAIADGIHPESIPPDDEEEEAKADEAASTLSDDDTTTALAIPARKFHSTTPYPNVCEASGMVLDMIKRAGKPGNVWYNKVTRRIRVCADDYNGEDDECRVGTYGPRTASRLISDLKALQDELGQESINGVAS